MDSLIRPTGPDAGFASTYLHTHERMTGNVALSIGYVEYRRDAQGGFAVARMKKLLGEDAAGERT